MAVDTIVLDKSPTLTLGTPDRRAALTQAIIPFIPLTTDLQTGHEESVS
jgi:hypothetical protein